MAETKGGFDAPGRGDYRAIHTVIVDSPEFIDLSPEAQLLFFHLKLRLGATGIDVLPAAEAMLSEATHYDLATVRRALAELAGETPAPSPSDGVAHPLRMGWLRRERHVFWLRNGLKFEPSRTLTNENHRKNVLSHLAGLPKLAIVNEFADYYDLERPFRDLSPYPSPSKGIPDHGDGDGRTETETTTTAAAVGEFLRRTACAWRLDTSIADWSNDVDREPKYAGVDLSYEILRCADWHVSHRKHPKAPDLAMRNWLLRAAADAQRPLRNGRPRAVTTPTDRLRVEI